MEDKREGTSECRVATTIYDLSQPQSRSYPHRISEHPSRQEDQDIDWANGYHGAWDLERLHDPGLRTEIMNLRLGVHGLSTATRPTTVRHDYGRRADTGHRHRTADGRKKHRVFSTHGASAISSTYMPRPAPLTTRIASRQRTATRKSPHGS